MMGRVNYAFIIFSAEKKSRKSRSDLRLERLSFISQPLNTN